MANNAMSVQNYRFRKTDGLFLDANIWLFIVGPLQNRYKTAVYSSAFRRILEAGSKIFVDVLVISEVINRYARTKWHLSPSRNVRFKEFRNSSEFGPIAKGIADDVRRIVEHCSRIESGFGSVDIDGLMDEYEDGGSDFNDQIIRELCRSKGLKLITDDGDFNSQGIAVLTANQRLLR